MNKLKVIKTGVLNFSEINKLKEFPIEYGIQRMIHKNNVEQIKQSMKQLYVPIVVKVNRDWFILDGQHSKMALKDLSINGADIVYVMYDTQGKDREVCVLLNTTGKKWSTDDFMDLWISCNNDNYIWFKELRDTFGLHFQNALFLLYGTQIGGGSRLSLDEFKNGKLEINDEKRKYSINIAHMLQDIKKYADKSMCNQRAFQSAFIKMALNEEYDHKTMISKLDYQRDKIYRCTNHAGYLDMLSSIYNYRNKNKIDF